MTVPLRHFFVALAFLLAAVAAGVGTALDVAPAFAGLAQVHLLPVGWVCVTIMGAMMQFVPVWSGTTLYSRRLANAQLLLVAAGLTGFALSLLAGALPWLAGFGALMLCGFWVFVANVSLTLARVDDYDVTERHFLLALLFTVFGLVLALDLTRPLLQSLPVSHGDVLGAHATLAVFGAVLTTVYGALYQLGTMFTRTELHGVDHSLQSFETVGHPAGVALLALGRLADSTLVAQVGGLLVLFAAVAVWVVLGRKLLEMQVERTPMHTRYGVVGFVILGSLYHIIPFVIWVHGYSDLLGFEDVPMIDDLYDDRLAAVDFALVFVSNLLLVVRRHSSRSLTRLTLGVHILGVTELDQGDSAERNSKGASGPSSDPFGSRPGMPLPQAAIPGPARSPSRSTPGISPVSRKVASNSASASSIRSLRWCIPRDADPDEVVVVSLPEPVPGTERALRERVALWTERRLGVNSARSTDGSSHSSAYR